MLLVEGKAMRKKIVHLITNDKFTVAYINFMKIYMKEYSHIFLVSRWSCSKEDLNDNNLVDLSNIIRYESGKQLAFGSKIRKLLKEADKIIVSGIFGLEQLIFYWPTSIYKKMYLHYWGGDFYQMRKSPSRNLLDLFQRYQLKYCFEKSYGAIFLIDGEYEKYREITGIIKENNFIASMPYDTYKTFPFEKYREKNRNACLRIVVGNSANLDNQHTYVFELLRHLKNEDIEIYCPLSYGDDAYGKNIEKIGRDILGEKFHPIFDWMKKEDYYRFLATCDIGIFGNDRQQGMGNIGALLYMGRKIYLKKGTSMYENYKKMGFSCYDIEELKNCSFEELAIFPEKEGNIRLADELYKPMIIREQWLKVLST